MPSRPPSRNAASQGPIQRLTATGFRLLLLLNRPLFCRKVEDEGFLRRLALKFDDDVHDSLKFLNLMFDHVIAKVYPVTDAQFRLLAIRSLRGIFPHIHVDRDKDVPRSINIAVHTSVYDQFLGDRATPLVLRALEEICKDGEKITETVLREAKRSTPLIRQEKGQIFSELTPLQITNGPPIAEPSRPLSTLSRGYGHHFSQNVAPLSGSSQSSGTKRPTRMRPGTGGTSFLSISLPQVNNGLSRVPYKTQLGRFEASAPGWKPVPDLPAFLASSLDHGPPNTLPLRDKENAIPVPPRPHSTMTTGLTGFNPVATSQYVNQGSIIPESPYSIGQKTKVQTNTIQGGTNLRKIAPSPMRPNYGFGKPSMRPDFVGTEQQPVHLSYLHDIVLRFCQVTNSIETAQRLIGECLDPEDCQEAYRMCEPILRAKSKWINKQREIFLSSGSAEEVCRRFSKELFVQEDENTLRRVRSDLMEYKKRKRASMAQTPANKRARPGKEWGFPL